MPRARCQKEALASTSAKREPAIWARSAVEVGSDGLREGAGADVDFGDGVVGDGGFAERPEEGVVLSGGGEALRGGGETLCHAEGEAEVDGEGEAGARAEEGAGDGIENRGVDEAFARAEIVVGQ